jgi:GNAT superfamily N-acetyltransferase
VKARPDIRTLTEADRPALEGFLQQRAESSLALLGNLTRGGVVCTGQPWQAHYLGLYRHNALVGVLALGTNELVYLQCPLTEDLTLLVQAWREWYEGSCRGLIGPRAQVEHVAGLLGGESLPFRLNNTEQIYSRDLMQPLPAQPEDQQTRPATSADLERLYGWRTAFLHEILNLPLSEQLVEQVRADLDAQASHGHVVLHSHGGVPVAMGLVMVELAGIAQFGGLYVPPEFRLRGYGSWLLAGLCQLAQGRGNRTAQLLSTRRHVGINQAALLSGFKLYGDFGIILFDEPVTPPVIKAA